LTRSLELQGKWTEAARLRKQLAKVWSKSEVLITTPCYCEPKV